MICVDKLSREYGHFLAVDAISFRVERGEVFGFLGPNGAGKTTTIRILSGQLRPTSGDIRVCGLDPVKERKHLHRIIGVVPEEQNLYERMTAKENLMFFARLYDMGRKRVEELLAQFDLEEWADEKVKNFSLGMKQRLLLARGVLPKPRVLFLDEPTKGLDPYTARYIRDIVRDASRTGITVFLTTHYMEEADELCNRVAIIDKGRIVALGSPNELKAQHAEGVIKIRLKDPSEEVKLSLSDDSLPDEMRDLLAAGRVLSVTTEAISLEDVFIDLTGSRLT